MRFREWVKSAMAVCVGLAVCPAQAADFDVSELYQVVPVEFSGTITSSISDRIILSRPNGTFFEYEGVRPDFPFDTGDTITIGFDAIVPTGAAIADGIVPPSADGIYRFQIGAASGFGATAPDADTSIVSFRNFQGTGIADTGAYISNGQLGIVYDANTGNYSIDVPTDAAFSLGVFDASVLRYDFDSDELTSVLFSELFPNDPGGFRWTGSGPNSGPNSGQIGSSIFTFENGQFIGGPSGVIRFAGGWNLPIFGQTPTQIPAPGMLILFGLGFAAIFKRRMIAVKTARI